NRDIPTGTYQTGLMHPYNQIDSFDSITSYTWAEGQIHVKKLLRLKSNSYIIQVESL
ncbi:10508_t:CDS:2, partial [Scutellospora calospora]